MPTFDRWDILAAFYWYSVEWGGTRYAEGVKARLRRLNYKPSLSEEFGRLSENGRAIYARLVEKEAGLSPGFPFGG